MENMQFGRNKKPRNTGKWWLSRNQRLQERKAVQKLFRDWTKRINKPYWNGTKQAIFTGGDYLENLRRHEASWG